MYIHIYIYTHTHIYIYISPFQYKMGMAQIPASKIQRVRDIFIYIYIHTRIHIHIYNIIDILYIYTHRIKTISQIYGVSIYIYTYTTFWRKKKTSLFPAIQKGWTIFPPYRGTDPIQLSKATAPSAPCQPKNSLRFFGCNRNLRSMTPRATRKKG